MKLIKPLTVLSLSALLSVSAYAETNKQKPATKPQKTQTQKTKPTTKSSKNNSTKAPAKQLNSSKGASTPKTTAPASNIDSKLAEFSKNVSLHFKGIKLTQENNQTYATFDYVLKNTSKRSIKKVHWITHYIANNQVILTQDVPLSFEQMIKPNQSIPLTFSVAWENLPAIAQQTFATNNEKISAYFEAKSITFSNNRQIIVE